MDINHYRSQVEMVLRRLVKSDHQWADDLRSDAYLTIARNIDKGYDRVTGPHLRQLIKYAMIDRLRQLSHRRRKNPLSESTALGKSKFNGFVSLDATIITHGGESRSLIDLIAEEPSNQEPPRTLLQVTEAMIVLTPTERRVVFLHYWERHTGSRIATELGVSGSRISQILRDARSKLYRELQKSKYT